MIYFDNAATTLPKPKEVVQAVESAMTTFGNPSRGAHSPALTGMRCMLAARQELAELFGVGDPLRIAFTPNATAALNIAISATKGHIVTTAAEHNSVLRPVFRKGNYTIVPLSQQGLWEMQALKDAVQKDTEAVVIGHASNLTGNVAPLEPVAAFCKSRGIKLIVDAAQSAGLLPIDMEALGLAALCFSGHKSLFGPQGTGAICLSESFLPAALVVGGSGSNSFSAEHPHTMPEALEAGTQNAHGIAGLLAGVQYVRNMQGQCYTAADSLARHFIQGVRSIPRVVLYGDVDAAVRTPVVALNLANWESSELAFVLQERYEIAVRAGAHCAPLMHRALNTEESGAVRFSFSHFNTQAEIDFAVEALNVLANNPQ